MTATATRPALDPFEDSDVVAAKIEIPDAAGGLREAMAVDPIQLHHGDEVHVVLHCRVKKVRFDPAGKDHDDGELTRTHVLETLEAAFIDDDKVAAHVRDNADRVKREVGRLQGIQRLDDQLDDEPDEQVSLDVERTAELLRAHVEGLHKAGVVVGCVACEERAADREADTR